MNSGRCISERIKVTFRKINVPKSFLFSSINYLHTFILSSKANLRKNALWPCKPLFGKNNFNVHTLLFKTYKQNKLSIVRLDIIEYISKHLQTAVISWWAIIRAYAWNCIFKLLKLPTYFVKHIQRVLAHVLLSKTQYKKPRINSRSRLRYFFLG